MGRGRVNFQTTNSFSGNAKGAGAAACDKGGMSAYSRELVERAAKIGLLLMDCDGVLTDGTIYFVPGADGAVAETKAFDCRDGIAFKWLREAGIETGIITGRGGLAVRERVRSAGMRYLVEGRTDKLESFEGIMKEAGLPPERIAYIGDDVTDLPLLKRVGLAAGPADARPEVCAAIHWRTPSRGGRGVVRDAAELLLKAQGKWERTLVQYGA